MLALIGLPLYRGSAHEFTKHLASSKPGHLKVQNGIFGLQPAIAVPGTHVIPYLPAAGKYVLCN